MLALRRPNHSLVLIGVLAALFAGCDEGASVPSSDDGAVATGSQGLNASNCPAGYTLIQGGSNADTLIGTAGNDCMLGWGGADTIWGRGGNDYIVGGPGDDILNGEGGNDQIFGEGDRDTISGGDGNDTFNGGAGDDTLHGGNGDDIIEGEGGVDIINGDADNDTLRGGDLSDTLRGGTGDDVLHGDGANDFLYGDEGDDVIDGDAGNDQAWGGLGDDVIFGDAGNDNLYGEAGDDALLGGIGTNTSDGGAGNDSCIGVSCELALMTPSGCTQTSQCGSAQRCIVDFGLCIGCVSNQDGDALCDSKDGCPTDAGKTAPGVCGCGVADTDSDADGTANCNDGCPSDAAKFAAGVCGCGVSDTDSDSDGTADCNDACPSDAAKVAAGVCGCGVSDANGDGDGTPDCNDGCPSDAAKVAAGVCGCGVADTDSDNDGIADCNDVCVGDTDGDGTPDCEDVCPGSNDAIDTDGDSVPNGCDACPNDHGNDSDGDGSCDRQDPCPHGDNNADADVDGVCDSEDLCVGADDLRNEDFDRVTDHCKLLEAVAYVAPGFGGAVIANGNTDGRPDILSHEVDLLNQGAFDFEKRALTLEPPIVHLAARAIDFDGDGILDALSGGLNWAPGTFLSYGNAAGQYVPHTRLSTEYSPGMAIGDLTGDGTPDFAYGITSLLIAESLPRPQRGIAQVHNIGPVQPQDIALHDANADGTPEIYLNTETMSLRIYEQNATGTYEQTVSSSSVGRKFALGDIDGDGYIDIVATDEAGNAPFAAFGMVLYRGLPYQAQPTLPGALRGRHVLFDGPVTMRLFNTYPTEVWPLSMRIARLGATSGDQVILSSRTGLHVITYDHALHTMRVVQEVPGMGSSPFGLAIGDLDADGKNDVVTNVFVGLRVLRNVSCVTGALPDGDADGIPDACDLCAGPNLDADQDDICDSADVCDGYDDRLDTDGDGTADGCDACPADVYGDSDGDGSCDSDDPCLYGLDTLDTDGDGVCNAMDTCPLVADVNSSNPSTPVANCNPIALGLSIPFDPPQAGFAPSSGDLNEDGIGDLLMSTTSSRSQWLGAGDGAFEMSEEVLFSDSSDSMRASLADLDGDGHLDAVLRHTIDGQPFSAVTYGDGSGSLTVSQVLSDLTADSAIADIDGDGVLDIVVAGQDLVLYRGSATGGAYQRQGIANNVYLSRVVVGAFEGDGVNHIIGLQEGGGLYHAVSTGTDSFMGEWLGEHISSYGWAPPEELSMHDLAVTDINRDGRSDLIVGVRAYGGDWEEARQHVSVDARTWDGRGYGSLSGESLAFVKPSNMLSFPGWSTGMQFADVLGDPEPELIVQADNRILIYDIGDSRYNQTIEIPAQGSAVLGFTASDVDGDGDTDIAVLVHGGITVLWNVRCANGTAVDTNSDGWADTCDEP